MEVVVIAIVVVVIVAVHLCYAIAMKPWSLHFDRQDDLDHIRWKSQWMKLLKKSSAMGKMLG